MNLVQDIRDLRTQCAQLAEKKESIDTQIVAVMRKATALEAALSPEEKLELDPPQPAQP